MTPRRFAEQLGFLVRRGYRGVTFSAAATPARGRRVAVTFDDAFASVAHLARPVLEALDWPGTVFAVSDFAASGHRLRWAGIDHWEATEFAHELEGLNWEELAGLAEGGWEIGSHTVTHPKLTQVDDGTLEDELRRSKAAVEAGIGQPCLTLAYPYGDVDGRVVAAAVRAGYAAAAALPAKMHASRRLEHPRVGVYHPDDLRRFRLKTARLTREARENLRRLAG